MIDIIAILAVFGTITVLGSKLLQIFMHRRQPSASTSAHSTSHTLEIGHLLQKNRALEERVENLEMIICRLDQKINAASAVKRGPLIRSHEDIVVG